MTNRRERRARKKGNVTVVDLGQLLAQDANHGLPFDCYVCGKRHAGLGLARIRDKSRTTTVPLCETCLADSDAVYRKYLNAPDVKIKEGGEITTEQLGALIEKQKKTEH